MNSVVRSMLMALLFGFALVSGASANEGDWRKNRVGAELHKSFGSATAEKKQGYGAGLSLLFPLTDSGFDLGARYSRVDQEVNSFTTLAFVFDYYVFPSYVQGLYVGGEVGVTNPNADSFFSIYDDFIFVGKIGYEYWIKESPWSAALELRRMAKTEDPVKQTSESRLYCSEMMISARYSF